MQVMSREYKVIVEADPFLDPAAGLADVRADLDELAAALGLRVTEAFAVGDPKKRSVRFLDTPDFTLRRNGLLLRQRVKKGGKAEYTLKCRSEDRYIAAAADLRTGPGTVPENPKFEEDIGVPFVSRFSHSITVAPADTAAPAGGEPPGSLAAAAGLFPGLLTLRTDDLVCPPGTAVVPVNGRQVFERVFKGPVVHLAGGDNPPDVAKATVALIVWSKGADGRPRTAELSFRYEDKAEAFPAPVAAAARRFFDGLQHHDWARPDARTKTELMYDG